MATKVINESDLSGYEGSRVRVSVNKGREFVGNFAGVDPFMNLVLEECVDTSELGKEVSVGTVVVRGSSVLSVDVVSD